MKEPNPSVNFAQALDCARRAKARRSFQMLHAIEVVERFLIFTSLIVLSKLSYAEAIRCQQTQSGGVEIVLHTPHPNQMGLSTPNGEFIWLQGEGAVKQLFPDNEFTNVGRIVIEKNAEGTLHIQAKKVQRVAISEPGKYRVYISDNLETEQENALSFSCEFQLKPAGK